MEEYIFPDFSRIKRSLNHIIDFIDGYSINYRFIIPAQFKPAFDIKLTSRMIKVPTSDPTGFIRKKEWIYTQGKYYSFDKGDVFYDAKEPYYQEWSDALKKIKCCIQISEASPAYPELIKISLKGKKKYSYNPGQIKFKLFRPDQNHIRLIEQKTYECTQEAFVFLLHTGTLKTLDKNTIKII